MIKKFRIRVLRNSEFLRFLNNVLQIVGLNGAKELLVENEFNDLKTKTLEAETFFKKIMANELTEELIDLDRKRDYLIISLEKLIEGSTNHYDEALGQHGRLLHAHLQQYGKGIAREAYQSETTILSSLVRDWETRADLSAAIKALQLEGWVTNLKDANTTFDARYVDRAQKEGNTITESLSSRRGEVTEAYNTLRDRLNAWHNVKYGEDPFGKTVNSLNALIDRYVPLTVSRTRADEAPESATSVAS